MRKLHLPYLALVLVALVGAARKPVAFQKCYAIEERSPLPALVAAATPLDVAGFLGSIPYVDQSTTVYAVHPRERYERTIVQGYGNCSNLVFGAAAHLYETRRDYQIVHTLPRGSFLDGGGHTVLRTRYELNGRTYVGLVDVLEGGIPATAGRPLDLADLQAGAVPDFSIRSLSGKHDASSEFYDALLDQATIGCIPGAQVNRYFAFLDKTYVALGSAKLEKYAYDGLAVVLGLYPKIFVDSIADTFAGHHAERRFYLGALWVLRSAVVILPLILLVELNTLHRTRRRARG
ncbi:MAG: hypothetical protein ACE5G2_09700 [Candidatus Krumholzibacteriia bacterium]